LGLSEESTLGLGRNKSHNDAGKKKKKKLRR
jgi:hypothetical protein